MCLLALAWKTHPRWRLLMIGNRDEYHARATLPLADWGQGLLAGRDLQSGGTWMGVRGGRAAVVTNVRDPSAPVPPGTTRGSLPLDYLAGDEGVTPHAERLAQDATRYAPFNLVLADGSDCVYLGNHPRPLWQAVEPGVHGMSNGGFDLSWPKTRRLAAALSHWVEGTRAQGHDGAEDFAPLWGALADERIAPDAELPQTGVGLERERLLSTAFIRSPEYGTRASTILAIDHEGQGLIIERRFGPSGASLGETCLRTA